MWVAVDGEKALQVRRLRWKFRGSERLDHPRLGRHVRVTWDLHGWLSSSSSPAVFVLRFESDDDDDDTDDGDDAKEEHDVLRPQGSFGKQQNAGGGGGESWCSSDSERRGWRRGGGPFRRYGSDTSPTVSVASTSATTSSAGSVATVSEWAVPAEANALKDGGGFSLVVHLWKKRK
ncbi:hypothetical protein QOZ80_6BG0463190 [Eleusine coracana subsp. coracana]|nr:hypothetical protein QOZ80_6BG0463190 [Eleusine coracana subsp. coracana]